ncbi:MULTISPECIES: hypothetical protein [Ralstonia]|jgi:hypothetical protein|uniref:Uncharacterized protein n=1 Tax=Ralstonia pickettii TaxID=329 RepID=A0A7X2LAD5_RALPI|nr:MULTISPECIES: hypothetical protein [Ralstonia]MRS98012.1 hypothetical protein [Ralstonia pickettii]CAJ0792261.1 hypothetical protein LMG18090_02817 [Ralstonia mannitolilytica]
MDFTVERFVTPIHQMPTRPVRGLAGKSTAPGAGIVAVIPVERFLHLHVSAETKDQ